MNIPEKHFYTIGDVCKLTGTKPHILRYWESQFRLLKPARRYSGHRKFTPEDIELIQKIRNLIIDRKYTLAGAKKEIQRQMGFRSRTTEGKSVKPSPTNLATLREIKKEISECLEILNPARQQELVGL